MGIFFLSFVVSGMPFTGMPLAGVNPTAAALGAAGLRMPGQPSLNCVLLVSNLNEEVGGRLCVSVCARP